LALADLMCHAWHPIGDPSLALLRLVRIRAPILSRASLLPDSADLGGRMYTELQALESYSFDPGLRGILNAGPTLSFPFTALRVRVIEYARLLSHRHSTVIPPLALRGI